MADKMAGKQNMDDLLDDLFAEAKADSAPAPTEDFMARILADAERLQPEAPQVSASPGMAPSRGLFATLFATLGGWQGTGGLVAATMASVWIGFSGADSLTVEGLQAVVSGNTDFYLSDLGGDFSFDLGEG